MAYTERQLYDAIVQLAIISHMKWWPWEDKSVKTADDQKGTSIFWREMTKYCWQAYTKANGSAGMAYIGRMADVKDLKGTLCKIDLEKGQTLFDEGTKGNALEMNKWAPVLNDSWVLGHIHRFADFELYSPRSFQNVWEDSPNRKGMVVTAREITGLETFGYQRETVTGVNVKYVCKDHKLAAAADLLAYDRVAKEMEAAGHGSVLKHMGLRDDVAAQIKGFDPRTLKPTGRK